MNKTYSDFQYFDVEDLVSSATLYLKYSANGPVYETTWRVTEDDLWQFGRDLIRSEEYETLDFYDYRYINGDITAVPDFFVGDYLQTEDDRGHTLTFVKDEEPND